MKPGDWLGYSTDTAEANVLKLAARKLGVPEDAVEMLRTGGAWLARERREETK